MLGYVRRGRRLNPPTDRSIIAPSWSCPECGTSLPLRRKIAAGKHSPAAAPGRLLILAVIRNRECELVITALDVRRLPLDLPLRCRCSHVRGVASDVSPSSGFRFICYCKDCQAFAHFLERLEVLDPAGGTDIFQMSPARVKLTAGTDAVRCLRLSEKGVRDALGGGSRTLRPWASS